MALEGSTFKSRSVRPGCLPESRGSHFPALLLSSRLRKATLQRERLNEGFKKGTLLLLLLLERFAAYLTKRNARIWSRTEGDWGQTEEGEEEAGGSRDVQGESLECAVIDIGCQLN